MIEQVELHPRREGKGLDAMLYGDLVAILSACATASDADREIIAVGAGKSQFSVVAGARNHLDLQLKKLLDGTLRV